MKRHNTRTFLRLEELEQREVPSTMLLPGHNLAIEPASFSWGVGRGNSSSTATAANGHEVSIALASYQSGGSEGPNATASSTNDPVGDIRLRRIVGDAATASGANASAALSGSVVLASRPGDIISVNF